MLFTASLEFLTGAAGGCGCRNELGLLDMCNLCEIMGTTIVQRLRFCGQMMEIIRKETWRQGTWHGEFRGRSSSHHAFGLLFIGRYAGLYLAPTIAVDPEELARPLLDLRTCRLDLASSGTVHVRCFPFILSISPALFILHGRLNSVHVHV